MTATQDQVVRKTVSLPESLWAELGNYRFLRRFPTETAAVVNVLSRGLQAGAVFGALADIAMGQRTGNGKFSAVVSGTFGNGPTVRDLVGIEVRDWTISRCLKLTDAQIQQKAEQVLQAAERLAGGTASYGQAAVLDIAVEWLIEWSFRP